VERGRRVALDASLRQRSVVGLIVERRLTGDPPPPTPENRSASASFLAFLAPPLPLFAGLGQRALFPRERDEFLVLLALLKELPSLAIQALYLLF
jgi:hypothetical protein